jgi:hypothetical protein
MVNLYAINVFFIPRPEAPWHSVDTGLHGRTGRGVFNG